MRPLYLAALLSMFALPSVFAQPIVADTASADTMTDAQRNALRAEIKAYLLEYPEVLIEAMEVLQTRQLVAEQAQESAQIKAQAKALFEDANSWVGGNPNGDVTIVEFTDYRCGYCRKAFAEIEELIKTDGNIRFIVKEFPILGDASVTSSRFAIAVLQLHGPDAYKRAHDGLITLRGEPDDASLAALAGELGLDSAPILARMSAPEVDAVIAANHSLGDALQITGTPTFVLNEQLLRGYVPLDQMQKLVADARG